MRAYGTVQDVTDQKTMELELIHLERIRAVGELSAGVSHNLNNILTAVTLPAQMLKRQIVDPMQLENVGIIIEASIRAKDLVHRLHLSTRGLEEKDLLCLPKVTKGIATGYVIGQIHIQHDFV